MKLCCVQPRVGWHMCACAMPGGPKQRVADRRATALQEYRRMAESIAWPHPGWRQTLVNLAHSRQCARWLHGCDRQSEPGCAGRRMVTVVGRRDTLTMALMCFVQLFERRKPVVMHGFPSSAHELERASTPWIALLQVSHDSPTMRPCSRSMSLLQVSHGPK